MLKNSYKLLFFFTLMLGTIISISSSSWLSIWMGLEINLLSFIPLSMKFNNMFSSESILKYFLTQALASSILLFAIISFSFFWMQQIFFMNSMIFLIFTTTLFMKMGAAPFHFWFPNVAEGLNWTNNLILMTWQKMAPMIILSFCLNYYFFLTIIIASSIFGAFGGLNQISLRKLIAYSSINHLSWMISAILLNQTIWKIYFFFYCFISLAIIFILNNFKLMNLNQMFNFNNLNFLKKTMIFFPLFSLGGLPPFLGFFPKWIVIEMNMYFNFYFMILILIFFSLITLYFYLRIFYSSLFLNHNETNWNLNMNFENKKKNIIFSFFSFFSLLGMMFSNLIFLFN